MGAADVAVVVDDGEPVTVVATVVVNGVSVPSVPSVVSDVAVTSPFSAHRKHL